MADAGSVAGPVESQSEEGGPYGRALRSLGHSSKIDARRNSPALNHFLEDVLGAQEELKWIDRAVHRSAVANNFEASSGNRRKNRNRKSKREYNEQIYKSYKPRSIYLEEEVKTKREVGRNENSSSSSLAALKRTILELSDSLNPRESEEAQQNEANVFESKRKLLWSENLRSAKGVAIAYYDYEDGADSAAAMPENSVEQEANRESSSSPLVYPVLNSQIPKKDENSEEERKEELDREKLKNKYPKEEFLSDMQQEQRAESDTPSSNNLQDIARPLSSSLYNSMVFKRIPVAPESDDSDFYSQCASGMYTRVRSCSKVGSFPDESEVSDPEEDPIIDVQRSLVDLERSDMAPEDSEPHLSGERTYLIISPGIDRKRSRKRSVESVEPSSTVGAKSRLSSSADKSGSNYFALKITDDMFKGGNEQSSPLDEDKPIKSTSFSSSSSSPSSASGNSFVSLKSRKTKTRTSPEWKVIEAVKDSLKMFRQKNSMLPERGVGRRLTQITRENPPSHAHFSSASPSSSTDNLLYSTTLTHQRSSPTNESSSDIDVATPRENADQQNNFQQVVHVNSGGHTNFSTTTHREDADQQNNFQQVVHVNSGDHTNFSTTTHREDADQQNNFQQVSHVSSGGRKNASITLQSLATTTPQLYSAALGVGDSSVIHEGHNNTRLRRHAGSYGHEDPRKRRRARVRRHNVEEGAKGRKRLSADAGETDSHHRKLTVLLAADNVEDESQIDLAVHGELANKIVDRIFEEVQRNEGLKVGLGPGLYRKHKAQESIALDKMYRQGLDEDEVKETEAMMRRVMELLGRLVLDEVRRKTCATLAPDMRDFLQWSLGLEELSEPLSDQNPPLPMIPGNRLHEMTERPPPSADKFLFQNSSSSSQSNDLSELERKVALLKGLINEYRALTEREKTQVQTVHDYLVRQLSLLMKYVESKEAASQKRISEKTETDGARLAPGRQHILQYQGSLPNRNYKNSRENGFNTTDNMSSNHNPMMSARSMFPYFNGHSNEKRGLWIDRRKRKRESVESDRARRRRSRDRSSFNAGESLEYRKLLRRIATLRRKKRDYSWGYEVPRIYSGPVELPSIPRVADLDQPVTKFSFSGPLVNLSRPVRGKNRLEDEVLLLNKRAAWRKENERLLEEVAFGKDTRNDLMPDSQKHLFNRDEEVRIKREFDANKSPISSTPSNSTLKTNETANFYRSTENLRSIEKKINVFPVETKNKVKSTSEINLMSPDASTL